MYLTDIVAAQKRGEALGITSLCTAHSAVLHAAMQGDGYILIESTCNQVNQYGGYTGMTPQDFVHFLHQTAAQQNFPPEHIILGGDHLGPNVWRREPSWAAMDKSAVMVQDYIQAGYQKIHLDCSMRLGDDPPGALNPQVSARRAALLAKAAENARSQSGIAPLYVIGTEVPVPGGAHADHEGVHVTQVADLAETLEVSRAAFIKEGLESAWQRVIAVVVQPGVEFGDDFVQAYDAVKAVDLSTYIESEAPVYEAHSTDYQTEAALHELVQDHFAILKVGPQLTFAYREAVFALAHIEDELIPSEQCSHLQMVLEEVMLQDPIHWQGYYQGNDEALRMARKYSLSDRVRYYWQYPRVQEALATLLNNLRAVSPPPGLISQHIPWLSLELNLRARSFSPQLVINNNIQQVLRKYDSAVQDDSF